MATTPGDTLKAAMGEPSFFDAPDGVRIGYYRAGPQTGLPVVLCHGFPELAYSWRAQIRALGDAGVRVVVPEGRGYGISGKPQGVKAYDMEHLTGDLCALLDHLGEEKAVFVGHDWGGLVTWRMPILHPERVAGLVGLNTPFLPRGPVDPITAFRGRYGDDMYIVQFQTPAESERLFEADVAKTMRFFMRLPAAFDAEAAFTGDPGKPPSLALQKALARYDPATDTRQLLSDDELAVFVDAYESGGFEGPINWYRNFVRNWEREEGMAMAVPMPCLMIMAEKDVVLPPAMAEIMTPYAPDLEKHLVRGSGHWTQQEKPDEVNHVLIDWLRRRFPRS